MSTYLVTGGGRGLGLEFVRQLSGHPDVTKVFTTTRSALPTPALTTAIADAQGKLVHVPCDVTKSEDAGKAADSIAKQLQGKGLDVLINNVGVQTFTPEGVAGLPPGVLHDSLTVNVVSAQVMTAAFLNLLRQGDSRKVVNISTTLGSITRAEGFMHIPVPSYKITKAALNMLTKQWALEYQKENFTFAVLSPGWVKTDLGGQIADLEVDVAAKACLDVVRRVGPANNGKSLNIHVPGYEDVPGPNQYDGVDLPW